jgi:hypothetical protein
VKATFRFDPFVAALATVLHAHEGNPDPGGGGGTVTLTPEQQKLVDAAVEAAVTGLKAKNSELLGKLKTATDTSKAFEGIDPARARTLIEQMDNDEDLKLIGEGKKNLVIEKHTERMRQAHTAELEAERLASKAERERADTYRGAVLDNHIRAVCGDLHKGAVEDALMHARTIFTLDAKGNAVKLDAQGNPELGKDGKSLFSPQEWMEMQRDLKPHWFPAVASGSGATGANGARGGTGKTMKRSAFEALPASEKQRVAIAGTTITD